RSNLPTISSSLFLSFRRPLRVDLLRCRHLGANGSITPPARTRHDWSGRDEAATTCWYALVALGRIVDLPRVLHHIHLSDVDRHELAVALLDLADIDVLHNLALRRVDHDRPARAVKRLALQEVDVLYAFRIGPERRHRLIDQVGAVPGRDRGDIRGGLLTNHLND